MQVSAGRVTPVVLKGAHAGGGRLPRVPQALQMTAVPLHVPPSPAVAVKDTCGTEGGRVVAEVSDGTQFQPSGK